MIEHLGDGGISGPELSTHDWTRALQLVIHWCPNDYAKAYAEAGFRCHSAEARRAQALYILCNLSRWRSAEATSARNILKRFARPIPAKWESDDD